MQFHFTSLINIFSLCPSILHVIRCSSAIFLCTKNWVLVNVECLDQHLTTKHMSDVKPRGKAGEATSATIFRCPPRAIASVSSI
ncbi:hypothetical protein QBC40DRAFT_274082 [Triangularia verruculosa]|uniref:Secreted protein n=1 Tax=Triangularia verruculosa TaxID=2587418 RepID=A0AAN6XNZ5_9PEZI|nr:hypothetical protein QBC40DRAFT_274082 [Triangularia verruculosa]